MMVASNKSQHSLLQWCWALALVLIVTWLFPSSVSGIAALTQVKGVVGGNVTFVCPSDKQKKLKFLYFQKDLSHVPQEFVNGYHAEKPILGPINPQTKVDHTERTVHMWGLNVSNSGTYKCHIKYYGTDSVDEATIQLSVTATYSALTTTVVCSDDNHVSSCLVTCASHGGYPGSDVTWNVSETLNHSSQQWRVMNSSNETDPASMLINSSSTAYFNCSYKLLQSFSCSVGGVTSESVTVCEDNKTNPDPFGGYVIVASCVAIIIAIITIVAAILWSRKGRKFNPKGAKGDVKPEEGIALKEREIEIS